jgi:SPP1 gp7 family putative phage head morphogenesis protein
MLAKNEIRLARASFRILKATSIQVAEQYESVGLGAAEDALFESRDKFYQALIAGYTATTKELISYTFKELGSSKKSSFQDIVQGYIQSKALDKSEIIAGTTQELMRAVILNGQQQGIGVSQIAANIRKAVSDTAPWRARTIGRTETHSAASFGMQAAAEETEEKLIREWVSVGDDRTREAHEAVDGDQREMDEPFEVDGESIDIPGEGSAENSINCRCTLIYTPK